MLYCRITIKTLSGAIYIGLSRLLVAALVGVVISGCGSPGVKPQTPNTQAQAQPPVAGSTTPVQHPQERPQATKKIVSLEDKFLARAQSAFRAGRLTEPEQDNAYDSFHAVLLLNSQNDEARAGLQAILIRYAELIRKALAQQDYRSAGVLLDRAQTYYPANALLLDLKKDLAAARKQEDEQMLQAPETRTIADYPLPPGALSRRSDTVADYLARIAQRLRETNESVMIHARTDAEGRWIYKQLNDAVPGYRVRGDIRLGRAAKIVILPPLQ